MSDFPSSTFEQRDLENVPGVVFDPDRKQVVFAEDISDLGDEVTAIEEVLGTDPQGDFDTVRERIEDAENFAALNRLFLGYPLEANYVKPLQAILRNLASGDNVIYQVPSGYKLLIHNAYFINNSGASRTIQPKIKQGGTTYTYQNGWSVTNGNLQDMWQGDSSQLPIYRNSVCLEAGDQYIINSSGTGGNAWIAGILIKDTVPIKSVHFRSFINGNNTIYTVPTGKMAIGLPMSLTANRFFQHGYLSIYNKSGGTRSYTVYLVPTGQSVGADYQVTQAISVGLTFPTNLELAFRLNSGDSLIVSSNSNAAGQLATFTFLELDSI